MTRDAIVTHGLRLFLDRGFDGRNVGTRLAGGCTSGHGVCGISRLSQRSIVATVSFLAAGVATVFVMNRTGI